MHLSNKQRIMNKTFTVLTNKYCSFDNDFEQEQSNCILENISSLSSTSNNNRFCTFTKCKIKQQQTAITVNQNQPRYFDSPTMITLDDDDDDIPISRCSNKTSVAEPSLNETDLSDLLIFTNPNRMLNESMQVMISRHPSLHDLKYINDVSSVLLDPPLFIQNKEEPIYQELIQFEHSISKPSIDYNNNIDENKENRPPLMPIKCQRSRIPVRTSSSTNKNIINKRSDFALHVQQMEKQKMLHKQYPAAAQLIQSAWRMHATSHHQQDNATWRVYKFVNPILAEKMLSKSRNNPLRRRSPVSSSIAVQLPSNSVPLKHKMAVNQFKQTVRVMQRMKFFVARRKFQEARRSSNMTQLGKQTAEDNLKDLQQKFDSTLAIAPISRDNIISSSNQSRIDQITVMEQLQVFNKRLILVEQQMNSMTNLLQRIDDRMNQSNLI